MEDLAVVVPTKDRPVRWLLNALEEQACPCELVSAGPETEALLRERAVRFVRAPDGAAPAAMRNIGLRTARAPLILFADAADDDDDDDDDDCRPPQDWVARALAAARAHPGAIAQGRTQPDPDELGVLHHAPHARSQQIVPPHVMAQTCNILYPRELLERVGGFDESFPQVVGEDADLALRARAAGAGFMAAPEVLTYHAVDSGLVSRLRGTWRWQHMALLVRRHPRLRRELPLGGWAWKTSHATFLLAATGLLARRPWLGLPWVLTAPRANGNHPRALARTRERAPRARRAGRGGDGGAAARVASLPHAAAVIAKHPTPPPKADSVRALAIALPTYWPEVRRGAERLMHDLAVALPHDVTIVTSRRGSDDADGGGGREGGPAAPSAGRAAGAEDVRAARRAAAVHPPGALSRAPQPRAGAATGRRGRRVPHGTPDDLQPSTCGGSRPARPRRAPDDRLRRRRPRAAQARRPAREAFRIVQRSEPRAGSCSTPGRRPTVPMDDLPAAVPAKHGERAPVLGRGVRAPARRGAGLRHARRRLGLRGTPEVLGGNDAIGRLFAGDDPWALARALLDASHLARDPATADRCRDRARAFSFDRWVERHDALYREVVER